MTVTQERITYRRGSKPCEGLLIRTPAGLNISMGEEQYFICYMTMQNGRTEIMAIRNVIDSPIACRHFKFERSGEQFQAERQQEWFEQSLDEIIELMCRHGLDADSRQRIRGRISKILFEI